MSGGERGDGSLDGVQWVLGGFTYPSGLLVLAIDIGAFFPDTTLASVLLAGFISKKKTPRFIV